MSRNKDFFKAFLSNRKSVGSVMPSSRFLTKKILDYINFNKDIVIVELGPGTGVFTREIQRRMSADSKLIVIELNAEFVKKLKSEFEDSRIEIIEGSATDLSEILRIRGIITTDYILSSLPLTSIPVKITEEILSQCKKSLNNDGKFLQFQYSLQQRKRLSRHFQKMEIGFTPLNFPPAFVYCCQN
jgi:phosphatidylethanolamine/phosphatidyl-N-methylethanolamine N-methyltransferase